MAAWRQLARRLTYELQNPLFPLQINIEKPQRSRKHPAPEFEEGFEASAGTLLAGLDNLKTIVARFSDFARMPAPRIGQVRSTIRRVRLSAFFDAQFHMPGRPGIVPHLQLDAALPEVASGPEQIRRLLHNLILNAQDAMPRGGTITTCTETLPARIVLEICDTGEG